MTLKVLMICDSKFPGDIRIEKEVRALDGLMLEIHILTYEYESKISEWNNVSKIHFVKNTKGKRKRGLIEIFSRIFGFDTFIFSKAKELSKKYQYDVIHCHDLPVASAAARLLKSNNKLKLIFDIHENYPEGVKVWYQWRKSKFIRIKNQIVNSSQFWKRKMISAIKHSHYCLVVCPEMKNVLTSTYSLESNKIRIVPNSEMKSFCLIQKGILSQPKTTITILYIGGIGPHRGLDCAIKSLKFLNKREFRFTLRIIGGGHIDNINHLKRIGKSHNVLSQLEFVSRIPKNQVFEEMQNADINLIPHSSNGHTETTVPHKLYQSMMAKKPLVVSNCESLKTATKSGDYAILFEKDSPESLAVAIENTISNKAETEIKVNSAFDFALNEGSWESTSCELTSLYSELIKEKNSTL